MRFARRFDLDGVPVRVTGDGPDLATVIDLLLGPYAAEAVADDAPAAIELELTRRAARPTPPAEPPRFTFPPLAAWPVAGGFRLVDDVADLTLTASATQARLQGWVAEGAPLPLLSRFAGLTVWVALLEALRARGRYPLHGAALVAPSGRVVLLAGTKGAGKSTATLALAERGFRVLTDDTLFVEAEPQSGAPTLLGYRKRFHVRQDLLARRPDLVPLARRPADFEPQDKRWLDLEARFPGCTVRRAGAPALILFPRVVDSPHTTRHAMSRKDALLALMAESSFVFVRPELAAPHLAMLGALADRAPAYRLDAGRDLLADGDRYLDLADEPRASLAS